MGKGKPEGPYAEQLTVSGGWTGADEDKLYEVATQATQALQQLTFDVLDPWQRKLPKPSTVVIASMSQPRVCR